MYSSELTQHARKKVALRELTSSSKTLKHTKSCHDTSYPRIEKVQLKTYNRSGLMKEIRASKSLNHIDSTCDRSAPRIEAGAVYRIHKQPSFMSRIKNQAQGITSYLHMPSISLPNIDLPLKSVTVQPTFLARREKVMKEIELTGTKLSNLKSVKCNDRSAPCLPASVQLKKGYSRKPLLDEIHNQGWKLDHVQCNDRSAPIIDYTIKIKRVQRRAYLDTILEGAQSFYTRMIQKASSVPQNIHLPQFNQSFSQPFAVEVTYVARRDRMLRDISSFLPALKKVDETEIKDRSAPCLPESVQVKKIIDRTELMADIRSGKKLNPTSCKDKSAPFIASDIFIRKVEEKSFFEKVRSVASNLYQKVYEAVPSFRSTWLSAYKQEVDDQNEIRKQLLEDISMNRQSLKHVSEDQIVDYSKPFIPLPQRTRLLSDISSEHSLKHVSEVHDRSSPVLPTGQVCIHKDDRKKLLSDISSVEHPLKHVSEIADRSEPALPKGSVEIFKNDRKELLNEIKSYANAPLM